MKNNLCLIAISSSCFFLKVITCSAMEDRTSVYFAKNPFFDAITKTQTFEEYASNTKQFENRCGICGDEKPEVNQWWAHPFGEFAHDDCKKLIHSVEESTVNGFALKPEFMNCDDVHRILIWFVMKLCLPKTIKEYTSNNGTEELTRLYSCLGKLAVSKCTDFLSLLERLQQQGHEKEVEKFYQDKKSFFAGAIFGLSLKTDDERIHINDPDIFGNSKLMDAAKRNDVNSVKSLLQAGAQTTLVNHKGRTALLIALKKRSFEAAHLIINASNAEELNMRNSRQPLTPLMRAAQICDDASLINAMLKRGADAHAVFSMLYNVSTNGADANVVDTSEKISWTALSIANANQHNNVVAALDAHIATGDKPQ